MAELKGLQRYHGEGGTMVRPFLESIRDSCNATMERAGLKTYRLNRGFSHVATLPWRGRDDKWPLLLPSTLSVATLPWRGRD